MLARADGEPVRNGSVRLLPNHSFNVLEVAGQRRVFEVVGHFESHDNASGRVIREFGWTRVMKRRRESDKM